MSLDELRAAAEAAAPDGTFVYIEPPDFLALLDVAEAARAIDRDGYVNRCGITDRVRYGNLNRLSVALDHLE